MTNGKFKIKRRKGKWKRGMMVCCDCNMQPVRVGDILKPNGTLIFKWSSIQIPLRDILKHIDHKPLYGHKSGKHSNTHWLAFVKFADEDFSC